MPNKSLIENKKYRIFRIDGFEYYAIKKHGAIYIYVNDGRGDTLWLEIGYKDVKIQLKSEPFSRHSYCYLMTKDEYGICTIIEIISKKVKKSFNDNQCVKKYKRIIEMDDEEVQDIVFVLWDKDDMWYSIWSLMNGFLFNTYEYTEIKQYSCGAILDNKIAVDIEGLAVDFSSYEEISIEGVYYSKEKNDYLYLLNDKRTLFVSLGEDSEDEDMLKVEFDDRIIKYNKKTEELSVVAQSRFEDVDWSQYNDQAYEGNSRLELGLDD